MKKTIIMLLMACVVSLSASTKAAAQDPITAIIKAAITKVIKAVDLQIQRLQTETIWLQNAQKVIENTMSKLHLDGITDWVQKQKDLYGKYYDELWQVKNVITYYHRIREIADKQVQLVNEYKRAYSLVQQDKHFTPDELEYMSRVYQGILQASTQNLDQLFIVINSFNTQMTDGKRLDIINKAAEETDKNYSDLKQFNAQNAILSIQRSKDEQEAAVIKNCMAFKTLLLCKHWNNI